LHAAVKQLLTYKIECIVCETIAGGNTRHTNALETQLGVAKHPTDTGSTRGGRWLGPMLKTWLYATASCLQPLFCHLVAIWMRTTLPVKYMSLSKILPRPWPSSSRRHEAKAPNDSGVGSPRRPLASHTLTNVSCLPQRLCLFLLLLYLKVLHLAPFPL
jgi:hypothetical protein